VFLRVCACVCVCVCVCARKYSQEPTHPPSKKFSTTFPVIDSISRRLGVPLEEKDLQLGNKADLSFCWCIIAFVTSNKPDLITEDSRDHTSLQKISPSLLWCITAFVTSRNPTEDPRDHTTWEKGRPSFLWGTHN